jgi:glycosyltransferase involved in cell wall biosynthesis
MRILISAYACAPGRGSEPGAGWQWAAAAAERHDVWLLTNEFNRAAIESELERRPELAIRPVYVAQATWIPVEPASLRFFRSRYVLWQRAARDVARSLHAQHGFDVAHHLTIAADWMPTGIADVPGLPLVWGPVGGTVRSALPMWRWLGARGVADELLRVAITAPARKLIGERIAARSALTVAMNREVEERFGRCGHVTVQPNVAIDPALVIEPLSPPSNPATRRAVFVGRLIAWKGPRLAVAALAQRELDGWELDLYGQGPEEELIRQFARELGIADRVHLRGYQPRARVIEALRQADALVAPSMRDSAGWAVAEAMALGCPVVALDRGGPSYLLEHGGGSAVPVNRHVVRGLAEAISGQQRQQPSDRWTSERLPGIVDHWYRLATTHDE